MNRSPDETSFLESWKRDREHTCFITAQEIVKTSDDIWPLVGFYAGEIANSKEDFLFVAERLAHWVEHFSATKRPPMGQITQQASVAR